MTGLRERVVQTLGPALSALTLTVVLFWPALATVTVAVRGRAETGAGLLSPMGETESGDVRRPLRLAVETVRLIAATELLALPVGVVLAFVFARTDVPGRRVMLGLLAVLALVPMPLHASAWLGAFGNAGRMQALGLGTLPVLVGWPGAAFVHAAAALPWVVLLMAVGLRTVEPELEESARLDLPAWRVATAVTLRRSFGAIAGAALAVAVLTAGDMTVTDLLQVRTYAEEAYLQYNLGNGPAAAMAVTLPPLLVLGSLVGFGMRTLQRTEPTRLASVSRAKTWPLGRWKGLVALGTVLFVAGFVGLPLVSLVWRAGRVGGNAALGRAPGWSLAGLAGTLGYSWDDASDPLAQSLTWSAIGATVSVALAWSLAWFGRRSRTWRWVTCLSAALALATPGPVAGMALVYAYRDWPDLYDSAARIVMAAVLRTFPYALMLLWPVLNGLPSEFFEAAAVEGLGTSGQARRVAWPLSRPAAVAAWAVAFTLALGELPATNLVSPPGVTPMSVAIWGLLHTGVESHTAGAVLVMLGVTSVAGGLTLVALARLKIPK